MTMIIEEQVAPAHAGLAATAQAAPRQRPDSVALMPREYLSFRLGAEEYGIDILCVQEIRSYEPPTRIAGAPRFVKGVLNLRGVIVPVVDLRLRFGCESTAYTASTVVVVLNLAGRVVGAVVDAVSDVVTLGGDSIKPAPALGAASDADCILGIGCASQGNRERMLILLDIAAVMGGQDLALASGAAA